WRGDESTWTSVGPVGKSKTTTRAGRGRMGERSPCTSPTTALAHPAQTTATPPNPNPPTNRPFADHPLCFSFYISPISHFMPQSTHKQVIIDGKPFQNRKPLGIETC